MSRTLSVAETSSTEAYFSSALIEPGELAPIIAKRLTLLRKGVSKEVIKRLRTSFSYTVGMAKDAMDDIFIDGRSCGKKVRTKYKARLVRLWI